MSDEQEKEEMVTYNGKKVTVAELDVIKEEIEKDKTIQVVETKLKEYKTRIHD